MFIIKRQHFIKIKLITILLILLANCQLQEPKKTHGISYLKNREPVLILNKSNKNDVVKLLGNPHSKSIDNDNIWFYFERMITRGKLHNLGRNILKENKRFEN